MGKRRRQGRKTRFPPDRRQKINHTQATDTASRQLAANAHSHARVARPGGVASRSRGKMHDAREPLDPDFEPKVDSDASRPRRCISPRIAYLHIRRTPILSSRKKVPAAPCRLGTQWRPCARASRVRSMMSVNFICSSRTNVHVLTATGNFSSCRRARPQRRS